MMTTANRRAKPDSFDAKKPHVKLQKCSHGSFIQDGVLYTAKEKKVEAQVGICYGRTDAVKYVVEGEEAFDTKGNFVGAWDAEKNELKDAAPATTGNSEE